MSRHKAAMRIGLHTVMETLDPDCITSLNTRPALDSVALLSQALTTRGYSYVPAARTQALLAAQGFSDAATLAADWPQFQASWERLCLDNYMADGGRYRKRRHATLTAMSGQRSFVVEPHQPHFQSREYNALNGGIARHYQPVEHAVLHGATLRSVVALGCEIFGLRSPNANWHIEVHQFRIEAGSEQLGLPTPEGVHRDGVDFVLMLMVQRRNVEQGVSTIYDLQGNPLRTFTLADTLDMALVDDERVLHGVSPIVPQQAGQFACRDVLVVTFRRKV